MSDPAQHYGIIELSIVEGLVLVLAFWQLWTVRGYLRRDRKAGRPGEAEGGTGASPADPKAGDGTVPEDTPDR